MGVAVGACRVWQWAPVEEELEPRQRGENCVWKCIGRKKFNLSCETKLRLVYDSYLLSETAFLNLHNNGPSRAVSNTHTPEREITEGHTHHYQYTLTQLECLEFL